MLSSTKYYCREVIAKNLVAAQKPQNFKYKKVVGIYEEKKSEQLVVVVEDCVHNNCSLPLLVCDRLLNQHHTHKTHKSSERKPDKQKKERTNEQK